MNKQPFKKRKTLAFVSFLLLASLCTLALSSCAAKVGSDTPLSPALNCIAEQSNMAKSALKGESISFSAEDFARATNLSEIESVTITSVPPITEGTLRVGSTVISSKQTLSAASLELMTYHAAEGVSSSEFRFRVGELPYEMCCKLYMLDKQNFAPTLGVAPETALEVSTYRNVTLFGSLPCYDPDGDATCIEIVSYPEKGVLILEDTAVGSYRFIPYEDSTGKDSFTYVAKDMYGNYSAAQTVTLRINKKTSPVSYVDLEGTPYHNAAIAMTESGIMSGTQVGNDTYFYPSKTVSRAEFTVMAMNAAGIKEVNPATTTVFSDDADIPSQMKSYVAAAYELGYINGIKQEDGTLCFEPNREISRAEAAVMLSNMLDAAKPTYSPVFSDADDVPAWAEASVSAMNAMGVLSYSEGNSISPLSAITRGDAADILSKFMNVNEK